MAIAVTSLNFDTFLTLIGPNGAVLFNDDDSGGGTKSRIPGSGVLTLGIPGTYIIEVNGFTAGASGPYTLSLTRPQSTIQLSSATYTVSESTGRLDLPIIRSGDTSGAASVDYATLGPSYVQCATAEGTALQNCDYSIGAGTLRFAPGEVTKTLTLLINDDLYTEGDEALALLLSNPVGTDLGTVDSATITVQDDDSGTPTTNPLDVAQFFVGQHYYDFLSRFPDSGGLDYWSFQITQCGNDAVCIKRRLVDVSNAFFYELEYQQTGAYVFRLYRAAFGNNQPVPNPDPENIDESKKLPAYAVFVSDRARVVAGSNLAQSQLEFASAVVQRPTFLARYPAQLNGPAFVDAVLTRIRSDSGSDLTSQRDELIALYDSGGRGAVMYRLADDNLQTNPIDNREFIDDEYNRAFVFTEYAGYLRRDADVGGFLFWLAKINESPVRDANIQHTMVCAFITSQEYQRRFSPVATRSNADCAP